MKSLIRKLILSIIIGIFVSNGRTFGQSIEVNSSLCTSSNILFQGAVGYGINLQYKSLDIDSRCHITFGLSLNETHNTKNYDQINTSIFPNLVRYDFSQVNARIERTSYRFNLLGQLRDTKDFYWGIGFDFSYNILKGHAEEQRILPDSNNTFLLRTYSFNFKTQFPTGAGLLTKVEIKNIFTPNLFLCFNIRSEFISSPIKLLDCDCGDDGPTLMGKITFTEFQLGLKYKFH